MGNGFGAGLLVDNKRVLTINELTLNGFDCSVLGAYARRKGVGVFDKP